MPNSASGCPKYDSYVQTAPTHVLEVAEWKAREAAHAARVEPWIASRLSRRTQGKTHPVDDFLFDYYPHSPAKLAAWHPGFGVVLAGSDADLGQRRQDVNYLAVEGGITASRPRLERHRERLVAAHRLLVATQNREPRFGCFGLHEWAMVYRIPTDDVRHPTSPLRLTPDAIAETVDAQGLRCTHFDAFRFYTDAARPLNEFELTRADQKEREQPGCLHATMDLYKWTYLFSPFLSSDLVADAFELARDVRTVDMKSSPYDFADLGLEPIKVETTAGRREFAEHQRQFAERGQHLRQRIIPEMETLLRTINVPPCGP